jgi:hypothetical protein
LAPTSTACYRGEFNLGQRNGSARAIGRRGRSRRWCRYVRRSATVIVSKFPVDIDEPVHVEPVINIEPIGSDAISIDQPVHIHPIDIDQSLFFAIIHHRAPNITNNTQLAVEHVADDARLTKLEHSG